MLHTVTVHGKVSTECEMIKITYSKHQFDFKEENRLYNSWFEGKRNQLGDLIFSKRDCGSKQRQLSGRLGFSQFQSKNQKMLGAEGERSSNVTGSSGSVG